MKRSPIYLAAAAILFSGLTDRTQAQADIPADYLSIIGATAGTVSDGYGSPGSIPVHGRASFPVLIDADNVPALAAGRYGNGVSPTAARAVAGGHTGFFNTSGTTTTSTLFLNSVLWASRKTTPATITVGSNSSTVRSFFSTRGYLTKAISTGMTLASNDLSGCDVFVGNFHDGFTANAITKINTFAANGGGVVVCSTPWALSTQAFNDAQSVLEPFGLSVSGGGTATASFTVAAASYPTFHSALTGLDQMIADATGGTAMTLANKRIAAGAVDRVLAVRPTQPDILAGLQTLENSGYGTIQVSAAVPLVKNNKPVEAMLARFQSGKFDAMSAVQLIAHPSAADWPGSPAPGSTVSRNFTVNGTVPADSYINWGDRGRRIETRLYAAPGATVTVTIPADKVAGGLSLDIGCHIDQNFHLDQWNRFPKVTRRVPLTQTVTQTGSVFGGIVWISIPAGANLGTFNVTISGALEAPCFQLGVDTDATWNATLKNLPGAWGCIMTDNVPGYGNTPGFTVYVSRAKLQSVTSAEAVALHWKSVIETADDRMGYTAFRKRGESALSDRDIVAGGGHAGWPVMMAYGDSDVLVDDVLKNGDWGFYHEVGHTFQDSYDGTYGIATHGEVDVNLVPALLNNTVHDKACWDGNIHSTFNGSNRLTKRTSFLAMPAVDQTWGFACSDGATAYDFYFNLAEAFGWQAYKTALSRLMAWNQGGTDSVLTTFGGTSAQAKRDRFFIIFCDATGRNLDTYFQRYGLGVTGLGYEISATAKRHISGKGYPVWIDNSAVDSVGDPGPLAAVESLAPGTVIADLNALDPEEPGTQWTWTITSGNTDGRLVIDKRSGELKVSAQGLDRESTALYTLGIRAEDGGVARTSASRTVSLSVSNSVEGPLPGITGVVNATSATPGGTVLGQAIVADVTRTISSVSILSGNTSGAFAVNAAGQFVLQSPASLPAASLVTLVVSGTDSAGQTGFATVRVLANATPGVREQRWAGATNFTNNTWTGGTNFTGNLGSSTTTENVADNYSRRLLGWLVPPVTGEYTFWMSSDDSGRFYLGTDAAEATKIQLAAVNGYTGFQSFDSSGSQVSVPVTLQAGRAYWFEAQQLEGGGGDHLSVAWQGAGIPVRSIIAGAYLVPNQAGIVVSNDLPDAPSFTSDLIVKAAGSQGSAYSGSIAADATDPDVGDTRTFTKVSGPAWLAVASNGTLSGTPLNANVGSNSFTVRVTDAAGLFDDAVLTIAVANVNDAPAFTTDPIAGAAATEDTAYVGSLAGVAGDIDAGDTRTFSKISGPGWLTVATNGNLGGLPSNSDVGPNSFVVRVTDAAGLSDDAVLNIAVANVNDAPVFTIAPITRAAGTEEAAYSAVSLSGTAADADAGDAIVYSKTSGPAWLTVANDGTLGGTPPAGSAGTNNFVVRATDLAGAFGEAALSIEIQGATLPLPWDDLTIGSGNLTGDTTFSGGIYTASGSGVLSGRNDSFGFTWQTLSGDGEIIARVNALQDTGTSSRVGVMIRDTLATNSRHVFMGLTGTGAYRWVRRTSLNGNTSSSNSSTGTVPNTWVRLVRTGSTITAYKSADGTAWTSVGSLSAAFPANCYIGLAVASGSNTTLNSSQFSNVTITP